MTAEEWRPVPGFPDYSVSSHGRVISHLRWNGHNGPREMRPRLKGKNQPYLKLEIRRPGERKTCYVHQLVALAFLGPRPEGLETRHLDGNSLNNHVDNLSYGTASENRQDCLRHGTHRNASLTECLRGHPFDADNTRTTRHGWRRCRTCARLRKQEYALRAARAAATERVA